jgi:hypothetical protein
MKKTINAAAILGQSLYIDGGEIIFTNGTGAYAGEVTT